MLLRATGLKVIIHSSNQQLHMEQPNMTDKGLIPSCKKHRGRLTMTVMVVDQSREKILLYKQVTFCVSVSKQKLDL